VRVVLAVIGCFLVVYVSVMVFSETLAALVEIELTALDLPTAVVCEWGRTYVEATPRGVGGRFEESRVGPCVFYNPESGGYVGD
jgi:hypothetical protein